MNARQSPPIDEGPQGKERPVRQDCVVSQAFPAIRDFAMTGVDARIPWASKEAEIGDRLEWVSCRPIGRPVSNLKFRISGICPWAWPRPVRGPRRPVRIASRAAERCWADGL